MLTKIRLRKITPTPATPAPFTPFIPPIASGNHVLIVNFGCKCTESVLTIPPPQSQLLLMQHFIYIKRISTYSQGMSGNVRDTQSCHKERKKSQGKSGSHSTHSTDHLGKLDSRYAF